MPQKQDSLEQEKRCLDAAYRLISRRDHSRMEIIRKLRQRGFPKTHIDSAVEQCLRYNYLDDDRFAQNHTHILQQRGFGIRRIRQSLREKGLSDGRIERAIQQHCTDQAQLEQCSRMLKKKTKSITAAQSIRDLKPKLYRYLLSRGFAPPIISTTLERTLEDLIPGRSSSLPK